MKYASMVLSSFLLFSMLLSVGYSTDFAGTITQSNPSNNSIQTLADTSLDFVFLPVINYPNATCELLLVNGATTYRLGTNTTTYNNTITTLNANSTFTATNYVTDISWYINCTNSTTMISSDISFFDLDKRGDYETQLSDLGGGLGTFLNAIGDPVANFILLLSIIGGIVAIFIGIATVIKNAISK